MKAKKKICVFTGSRAEYGILSSLMRSIDTDPEFELNIVATNMHLSPEFGKTVKEIVEDGFRVDKQVEMLLSSDTPTGTAKSLGLGIIGFADALTELKPDLILILGDRYEMLGVAETALLFNIPIAHLHGGEITEGAYDDAIRHAITKLSHIHFAATEEYRENIIRMGENPESVYNVGALGTDNIRNTELLSLESLEQSLGFSLGENYVVVTFHPVTREPGEAEAQTGELLDALAALDEGIKVLVTLPNSDAEGRAVTALFRKFEKEHPEKVKCVASLGRQRYYTALANSKGVIGNSSSGLIEVPSFGVPTLNIGNRQKGRARGESVIDVDCNRDAIAAGIKRLFSTEMQEKASKCDNPYYKENTIASIMKVLKSVEPKTLLKKSFYKG